jgi:predicted Zn-dependent protease
MLRMAPRKKMPKLSALAVATALAAAPISAVARAEKEKGPAIIRDTEAEQLLRDYTRPILRAAGLEKQNIQIVIINESVFNAFVADGRRIFVNYGALMQSETPNQIIGVLAHETGHLAGGHLARLREQLARAQTQLIIATLLGVGALAASSATSSSGGLASAGAAGITAPHDARQDLGFHGAAGYGLPALSIEQRQPAVALCPRHPICMAICAPPSPRSTA